MNLRRTIRFTCQRWRGFVDPHARLTPYYLGRTPENYCRLLLENYLMLFATRDAARGGNREARNLLARLKGHFRGQR